MTANRSDWSFRPKEYFGVLNTKKRIVNRIPGTTRRRAVEAALDEGDPASVPPLVIGEQLDEGTRRAFGRVHPAMMGGEYLPAIGGREVEIARIEIESVTADVISIRAREGKSRITYSIVNEYGMTFSLAIKSSSKPLTLRQMVRLIQKSCYDDDHLARYGIALSHLVSNYEDGGQPLEELEGFVKVRSDFYPQLEDVFDDACDSFMLDRAFDRLSVSARRFMAQFTEDERDTLESEYGRPWHSSFRTHIEEIECYDVDMLKLKRRFGPPERGWFEDIKEQLEEPKMNSEDMAIVKAYSRLSSFHTIRISGAMSGMDGQIRRNSVEKYCLDGVKQCGQLPNGEHVVPFLYNDSTSKFVTMFPDRELAEAASLVLATSPSRLAGLLDAKSLAEIVPKLNFEALRRVEIIDEWVGLGEPPHVRQQWCFVHPDEAANTGRPPLWSEGALQDMIAILRRLSLYERVYVPLIDHTDDCPSIKIRLVLTSCEITIGSRSQGPHRVPWYVDIGKQRYVVNTAIPSFAFEVLRPALGLPARVKLP